MNENIASEKTENSHNNPPPPESAVQVATSPAGPVQSAAAPAVPEAPARQLRPSDLVPRGVRERRWRASSFASKLTSAQWATLRAWLLRPDLSIEEVRRCVAAPAPQGFGLDVCATTLRRLKELIDNSALSNWVAESADVACDVLQDDDNADVAPMHEALRALLYTRAIYFAKEQAEVDKIDKLLSAIQRLEKIRSTASRAPREPHPPAVTHHRVEVAIAQNGTADSGARIVDIASKRVPPPSVARG